MNFVNAVKTCFIKYGDVRGRASRAEFWYFTLFEILAGIFGDIIDAKIAGESYWTYDELYGPSYGIIVLLITCPSVAVATRRLHDIGKSGWWQLLYLTVVGIIPLIIWFSTATQSKQNKFGDPATAISDDQSNLGLPKWIKFFLIPVGTILFGSLMLFWALIETGVVSETKVIEGSKLNSSVKVELINHRVLSKGDKIIYFYSTDLFSFSNEGQLITENSVITYIKDEEGIIQTWKMNFNEIDRVEQTQQGDVWQHSVYKIYGNSIAKNDWIEVWLSSEDDGDKAFVNYIEKRL